MHKKHPYEIYATHPEYKARLFRRTQWIIVMTQIFGGAGLAAGITVGALLAEEMLGQDALTGLPTALFTLGSAFAAFLVGRLSNAFGRRVGVSTGFLLGGLGAFGVVLSAVLANIPFLFLSLFIYGSGTATNLQARYAGTDLADKKQRGKSISIAMFATTFGAVLGPNLVGVMRDFATSIGVPELAGPFILAAVAFSMAGVFMFIFLRPDPFKVALYINEYNHSNGVKSEIDNTTTNSKLIMAGAIIMVLSQVVMVAIMTMTPIHMGHHEHDLERVGLVISLHIAAMWLPSPLTGILVDKFGVVKMTVAGGVVLLLAGLSAALLSGDSVFNMALALILLGLGWNFGLISGTTLIVNATAQEVRAKTQGLVDVFIALGGATGGAMSGMVVAGQSFEVLSLIGGGISLLMIPIVLHLYSRAKLSG